MFPSGPGQHLLTATLGKRLNDKLGVYIPTYNRSDKLRECLDSFIPQVREYGFPIYVSDNGSEDGTEEVVNEEAKDYENIVYHRNSANLGYAGNLASVLQLGATEFAWVFADDDLIAEGAIDEITKHLAECDFLQINASIFNKDFSRRRLERVIPSKGDVVYEKGMHQSVILSSSNLAYCGFIAGIITRLKYLTTELKAAQSVSKNDFLHTVLFYRAIVNRKGRLIARPLIKRRGEERLFGRDVEIWMSEFPAALDRLRPEYSARALRAVGRVRLPFLASLASRGRYYNPSGAPCYWRHVNSNTNVGVPGKIVAFMILKLPFVCCSVVYRVQNYAASRMD